MGLMEKTLGVFVDLEEKPEEKFVPKPNLSKITSEKVSSPIDNAMYDRLNKVVLTRKTSYTALLETCEKLKRSIPDDATRLRASFDLISADGRSLDGINQAIDIHISDLDGEHLRFKATTESQLQQKSKAPREKAQSLTNDNESRLSKIENMKNEIAQHEETIRLNTLSITDLNNEADKLEYDIKSVYEQFKVTLDQVKTELQTKKSILANTINR